MKRGVFFAAAIIIAVIFFGLITFFQDIKDDSLFEQPGNQSAEEGIFELQFYDPSTNCRLSGDVYFNKELVGEAKEGILHINQSSYNFSQPDLEVILSGNSGQCLEGEDFIFKREWIIPSPDSKAGSLLVLEAELSPRYPRYYEEMQDFVRPDEVRNYLDKLNKYFKNNTEKDLDKIADYRITYMEDFLLFKKSEYWQSPAETLRKGYGDCEDWALAILSLIRAYNSSLQCYNAVWKTHISIFCYFSNNYIIYDQGGIKHKTKLEPNKNKEGIISQENKIKLRQMRNNYFEKYGISPDERKIHALFNEKELVIFEEDEEFISWMLELNS